MARSRRARCAILVAVLVGTSAWAAPNDELKGLTDREYVEYARDRFEWLVGEARSSQRLAGKFREQCRKGSPDNDDTARACEVAKAADEQTVRISQEGHDLVDGLRQRLGNVPPWALHADADLEAVNHQR
jgi:hypothetical protein